MKKSGLWKRLRSRLKSSEQQGPAGPREASPPRPRSGAVSPSPCSDPHSLLPAKLACAESYSELSHPELQPAARKWDAETDAGAGAGGRGSDKVGVTVREVTSPAPSSPTSVLPLPDQLWNQAYARFQERDPGLVAKFEKILAANPAPEATTPTWPDASTTEVDDPTTRQQRMHALARQRLESMDKRGSFFKTAATTTHLLSRVFKGVSRAVEASQPAALALVGVCLILDCCAAGFTASEDCLEGLSWIVPRLDWYLNLPELTILRDNGEGAVDSASGMVVYDTLKADMVALYTFLIQYQVESVCAYYKSRGLFAFLKDATIPEDWAKLRDKIEKAEIQVLRDAGTHDRSVAASLRSELLVAASNSEDLLRQLVEHSREAGDREQRRELREVRQIDEGQREKINKLTAVFSVPGVNYKAFKDDLNPELAKGTGIWLRNHSHYLDWTRRESGILVLAAPPGCGKSVLARSVVDEAPSIGSAEVVCHFFFKDAPMRTSLCWALCAILHQLFVQQKAAVLAVRDDIESCDVEQLRKDPDSLWALFTETLRHLEDTPSTRVLCVFDALDEAEEASCQGLIRNLKNYFGHAAGGDGRRPRAALKVFTTCRPYEHILLPLSNIRSDLINLETRDKELDAIGVEVNAAIEAELVVLATRPRRPASQATIREIREALTRHPNRTYLWVRLVFLILRGTSLADGEDDWREPLYSLPRTVDDAYQSLLSRVSQEDQYAIRTIIAIILSVDRRHFWGGDNSTLTIVLGLVGAASKLDGQVTKRFASVEVFATWLTNTCGFLLQVSERPSFGIDFIHQTAKEFLVNPSPPFDMPSPTASLLSPDRGSLPGWKAAFSLPGCHQVVAEACISFLASTADEVRTENDTPTQQDTALAMNWALVWWNTYFSLCQRWDGTIRGIADSLIDVRESLVPDYEKLVLQCSGTDNIRQLPVGHGEWSGLDPAPGVDRDDRTVSVLGPAWASAVGHLRLMRCFDPSRYGADELKAAVLGMQRDRTSNGVAAIRWILLMDPSLVNKPLDEDGRSALFFAHREDTAQVLLAHGADLRARDNKGQTMFHVCGTGMWDLLEAGAGLDMINLPDQNGETALHTACNIRVAQMLISYGADFYVTDNEGNTPFHAWCAKSRACWFVVFSNVPVSPMSTALRVATDRIKQVCDTPNNEGETALAIACRLGKLRHIRQLVSEGADPTVTDKSGRRALDYLLGNGWDLFAWDKNEGFLEESFCGPDVVWYLDFIGSMPGGGPERRARLLAELQATLSNRMRHLRAGPPKDLAENRFGHPQELWCLNFYVLNGHRALFPLFDQSDEMVRGLARWEDVHRLVWWSPEPDRVRAGIIMWVDGRWRFADSHSLVLIPIEDECKFIEYS